MKSEKIALANAGAFFFLWLVVLLAGADKPPPIGFLWIVLIIAICTAVVYWRVPTYVEWGQTQLRGSLLRVALEGFLAGLVVAMPFVFLGSGNPTIPMGATAYVVWFVILGLMGMLNSVMLYVINAVIVKRFDSD